MTSKQSISQCFGRKADSKVREKFLETVTAELSSAEWLEEEKQQGIPSRERVACKKVQIALILMVKGVNGVRRRY